MPPRAESRTNWPLIIFALWLFLPIGLVLLIVKPQRKVKSHVTNHAMPEADNTTSKVVAGAFFHSIGIICMILFVIGAITGITFIGMIALFIGFPSFILGAIFTGYVDNKRDNYYYWRHYDRWK
jgi:Ca2+/Na+ antiporter